ncbi:MAG: S8 family serine peptidase [Alphaproteobacteria bacterium]|nr:S8 family serine peptidase [Alphaproteobacteria bacterium]
MKHKYLLATLFLGCLYQTDAFAFGSVSDKLYAAARAGDTATLESYLREGHSIDTIDNSGRTALCNAYYAKDWTTYNVLMQYGANPNASCMLETPKNYNKYVLTGVGVAIVGGVAIAAASGGGGGSDDSSGSSSSSSSSNSSSGSSSGSSSNSSSGSSSGTSTSSNDDSVYTLSTMSERQKAIAEMMSKHLETQSYSHINTNSFHYYTTDDFRSSSGAKYKEYSGQGASASPQTVNFLDAIRAAQAYSYFYGYDSNNKVSNKLDTERNVVAVLDTGVEVNHSEFIDANGKSKVSGKSFDYGPCRGADRTNCWLIETYEASSGFGLKKTTKQKRTLYDANGEAVSGVAIVDSGYNYDTATGRGELDDWADEYTANYDWDQLQDDPSPSIGKVSKKENGVEANIDGHGTHVAGIIAANMNDKGMMGVAFSNTDIYALRWDLTSPISAPIQAALGLKDRKVLALNMSVGTEASSTSNAGLITSKKLDYMQTDTLLAARDTIRSYETVQDPTTGYKQKQGMIWVMAAGNDSYSEPTIMAGIKNLGTQITSEGTVNYNDLMMLVVMSVDVTLNDDGTVKTYTKSSFSNSCGSTAAYCIAAPGGNKKSNVNYNIYSSVPSAVLSLGYGGLLGTSQATPVVTGSIAFLKSAFPFLHSSEIIEILRETANTNGVGYNSANHEDKTYGAGLLDLGKATTYYIPPENKNGTMSMATLTGTTVASPYVNLSNANLTVSPSMSSAVMSALPATLTIFDKYKRPFEVSTSHYIRVTHAGYKSLKNDVGYIVPNTKIKEKREGNMRFSYAQGTMNRSGGIGFTDATYKSGKFESGFYMSENTRYRGQGQENAEMSNPYMSFTSAYGAHIGYQPSGKYGFKLQAVSGRNGLYGGDKDFNDRTFKKTAYAVDGELSFKAGKKLNLSFNSGMLYEDEALLGVTGTGAFGLPESRTYFTGVTAMYKATPKLTLSGSYYRGYTDAQSFNSNMLQTSALQSSSFAIDANYKWNKTTDFGLRLSSPLRVEHGKLRIDMASGRDYYSDEVYRNRYTAGMKSKKREYKLSLYGNKGVTENLSLSSELGVRFNPEHRAAANDYRALFGLAWNF